jgi:hypothetical protein
LLRFDAFVIDAREQYRDSHAQRDPDARYFAPHFNAMMKAELRRFRERPPELQPAIDALEAHLVRVFLRRYVTYCARRRRFAAMNGAARLYAEFAVPSRLPRQRMAGRRCG